MGANLPAPYYDRDGLTVYVGDSLTIMAEMDTGSLGGCVTDPPYSSGGMFRSDRTNHSATTKYSSAARTPDFSGDNRDQRGFMRWCAIWMAEALRVCESGSPFFTFTDWRQLPTMTDAIQAGGWSWQGLFVWDKKEGRPQKNRPTQSVEYLVYGVSGQVRHDEFVCIPPIIQAKSPRGDEREHTTQKPVEVHRHIIPLARKGTTIIDPFMGSGTTLIAARDLGYRAVGIEIDERHAETAVRRLNQQLLPFGGEHD